jgi:hypothetical protein
MVTADPYHPRTIRVAVSGVAPRGPAPTVHAAPLPKQVSEYPTRISVRVQQRDATMESDLAWSDASVQVVQVTSEKDGYTPDDPDFVV